MAQLEKMIPFIIQWESGVQDASVDNETLFSRARAKGVVNDPADAGGATLVGVTIATFQEYRRRKGLRRGTEKDLARLSYAEWLEILQTMFWDRWKADQILDQKVAEILVDWVWASGAYGVTIPQRVLGVKADGIVGPKTLAAVNSHNPKELFAAVKQERIDYVDRICRRRPANLRFRTGWLRRINSI